MIMPNYTCLALATVEQVLPSPDNTPNVDDVAGEQDPSFPSADDVIFGLLPPQEESTRSEPIVDQEKEQNRGEEDHKEISCCGW